MHKTVIGVDFDNTIAGYDELMHGVAVEAGFISADIKVNKQKIRDHLRSLKNGEMKWQELQAKVYGESMFQAKLIEGVRDFFSACYRQGTSVFIISHKTQFAARGKEKVDLHRVALEWMKEKGIFQEDRIFFEPTRQKKIERIMKLGCTHFIDDLEEIFLDKIFPPSVQKILFAPQASAGISGDMKVFGSWREIDEYFFGR